MMRRPQESKKRVSAALLLSDILDGNDASVKTGSDHAGAAGGGGTITLTATKQDIDDTLLSGIRGATAQPGIAQQRCRSCSIGCPA